MPISHMIERLQSQDDYISNTHDYPAGAQVLLSSSSSRCVMVLSGAVDVVVAPLAFPEVCFCMQTLAVGDWLMPSRDLPANLFAEIRLEAATDSTVWFCSEHEFQSLLVADPGFLFAILDLQRTRTFDLRCETKFLRIPSAVSRLFFMLLSENDFNVDGQTEIEGKLQTAASRLNLVPETLSRILAELERKGHISRDGRSRLTINRSAFETTSKHMLAFTSLRSGNRSASTQKESEAGQIL